MPGTYRSIWRPGRPLGSVNGMHTVKLRMLDELIDGVHVLSAGESIEHYCIRMLRERVLSEAPDGIVQTLLDKEEKIRQEEEDARELKRNLREQKKERTREERNRRRRERRKSQTNISA